jgi:hypothetical protein
MPSPADRDGSFERLLRQSLQAQATAPEGCLDADTLASIVDGRLPAEALTAAEAHVADCGRCQATMAALVRTEPEPEPRAAWWRVPSLRWLAPAAAAAAAVAIWFAVDTGPHVVHVRQEAAAPTQPATAAAVQDDVIVSPPAAAGEVSRQRIKRGIVAGVLVGPQSEGAGDPKAPLRAPVPERPAPASPPPTASAAPPGALARRAAEFAPSGALAGPPPANAAKDSRASAAVPRSPLRVEDLAIADTETIATDIPSSDPRYRWRLVGRAVQRSTDGGATWQDQSTGVISAVNAGSAASPEVCWLVGDGGLVLVTVDGLSWQRVSPPADETLVSVSAASADAATVTTRDGRTFTTVDRGRTWITK